MYMNQRLFILCIERDMKGLVILVFITLFLGVAEACVISSTFQQKFFFKFYLFLRMYSIFASVNLKVVIQQS